MSQDVLEYLEDCYSFLGDPAIGKAIEEIKELRKKNEFFKTTIRSLDPENFPGPFIHGMLGEKDMNGMPEKLLIVPALGCDFSYIYERTDKTTGTEW